MKKLMEANKIGLTTIDNVIEIVRWSVLVLMLLMVTLSYSKLPDEIPFHFNGLGQVDNYASRETIFLFPGIVILLFILLKVLNRFPNISNFGRNVKAGNAQAQYTLGTKMARTILLGISILFTFITYRIIQIGTGKATTLGPFFLLLVIGVIFIPIIYFIFKMIHVNRT